MGVLPNHTRWDRVWYAMIALLAWLQAAIYKHCLREHYWRSWDGKVRRLQDLSDVHLNNCIRMLQREGDEGGKLPMLYEELRRRMEGG